MSVCVCLAKNCFDLLLSFKYFVSRRVFCLLGFIQSAVKTLKQTTLRRRSSPLITVSYKGHYKKFHSNTPWAVFFSLLIQRALRISLSVNKKYSITLTLGQLRNTQKTTKLQKTDMKAHTNIIWSTYSRTVNMELIWSTLLLGSACTVLLRQGCVFAITTDKVSKWN